MYHLDVPSSVVNPRLCRELNIWVEVEQMNEDPTPHLHVYFDEEANPARCAYIRLDSNKYYTHEDGRAGLEMPLDIKDKFLKLMTARWSLALRVVNQDAVTLTGYEFAVDTWVDTYRNYNDYSGFILTQHGDLMMPDYSKL